MAKPVKKSDGALESALDVFGAVKRAFMHHGLYRQKTKTVKNKKDSEDSSDESKQKQLATVAKKSHEILFKASTVFPFSLFPDTITVDREKVSYATRQFIRTAQITSVPVRDILSVEADIGPFFGSVHTRSRFFINDRKTVNWLRRADAVKLQRILQGYIIAMEQDIDCDNIEKNQLVKMLNDLGTGRTN